MKILLTVVTFTIVFVLYVRFLEQTSVFYPESNLTGFPSDVGLEFEEVYFKSQDHKKLYGWFVPSDGAKGTMIFLHGNAGNISDRLEKLVMFNKIGVNVFIVDYRGYSLSEGKPSEKGIYLDALAAYDYLKKREDINKDFIMAYGASLGGAAAVDLATKRKLAALVADSTFTSAVDMAKRIYPVIPSFLISLKFDSVSKITDIKIPKLFLHSRDDETVPFSLGYQLYETAPDPKEFIEIQGSHNDGHVASRDIFIKGIEQFLTTHHLK